MTNPASPLPSEPPAQEEPACACGTRTAFYCHLHPESCLRTAAEEPPELKEALDDLEAVIDDAILGYADGVQTFRAARAALEALYDRQREEADKCYEELTEDFNQIAERCADYRSQLERQREEIERLRSLGISEDLSEALGTTGHIVERLTTDALSIADQLDSAERELERLKAEQLTTEEAATILRQFGEEWYAITSVGQSMHSKLRRLTQSDTGDTNG